MSTAKVMTLRFPCRRLPTCQTICRAGRTARSAIGQTPDSNTYLISPKRWNFLFYSDKTR